MTTTNPIRARIAELTKSVKCQTDLDGIATSALKTLVEEFGRPAWQEIQYEWQSRKLAFRSQTRSHDENDDY